MTTVDVQQAWGSLRRLGRTGRRSRARAMPVELAPSLAVARAIAFTVGLLAAWAVLYGLVLSGLQEHRAQHNLFATFREQLSTATAPTRAPIALGRPVAVIDIPSLDVHRLVVVEGTGAEQLRSGPGHRPDSVLPGQAGASVLFGRSTTFGAPFRRVPDLTAGTTVVVTTGQGHFVYTVTGTRHPGDPLPAPLAAGRSALTLVTSSSRYGGLGGGGPVYVDASMRGAAVAAGGVRAVTDAGQAAYGHDGSALLPLILWLQLLVVAAVGTAWAWRRWGARQTWLVGVAVVVAVLWGASDTASLLLPNLV